MAAAPQLRSGIKFKVQFQLGPLAGQSMAFNKAVVQIGRGAENDLVLLSDLRASRLHAEIRWNGQELQIVNLSSKNFIAVNGRQVESAVLEPGAVVIVGESEFRVDFEKDHEFLEPQTKLVRDSVEPPVLVQMPVRPQVQVQVQVPKSKAPRRNVRASPSDDGGKLRFYGLVLVIGLVFAWLMTSKSVKQKELTVRSAEQIKKDIEASQEELRVFAARKERLDNIQYKRAQENYIRGFRDYKQGNYGRARESFQVVLNLDPDNELAKRYYQLARLKFDERVKFHMLQGNRYREKKNWRMCKSSYFNVMTMVNNNQDPVFREAKQYYDQCSLAQEGRY